MDKMAIKEVAGGKEITGGYSKAQLSG